MSDLMKYNAILPKDDDYHLWYDSLKGWRLDIRGVGNCGFNEEADILFQVERERIIKLLEEECAGDWPKFIEMSLETLIALINGENVVHLSNRDFEQLTKAIEGETE